MDAFGGAGNKSQGIVPDADDGQYDDIDDEGVALCSLAVDSTAPQVKTLKQVLALRNKVR
jgi:hypothetical protein